MIVIFYMNKSLCFSNYLKSTIIILSINFNMNVWLKVVKRWSTQIIKICALNGYQRSEGLFCAESKKPFSLQQFLHERSTSSFFYIYITANTRIFMQQFSLPRGSNFTCNLHFSMLNANLPSLIQNILLTG